MSKGRQKIRSFQTNFAILNFQIGGSLTKAAKSARRRDQTQWNRAADILDSTMLNQGQLL